MKKEDGPLNAFLKPRNVVTDDLAKRIKNNSFMSIFIKFL